MSVFGKFALCTAIVAGSFLGCNVAAMSACQQASIAGSWVMPAASVYEPLCVGATISSVGGVSAPLGSCSLPATTVPAAINPAVMTSPPQGTLSIDASCQATGLITYSFSIQTAGLCGADYQTISMDCYVRSHPKLWLSADGSRLSGYSYSNVACYPSDPQCRDTSSKVNFGVYEMILMPR